MWVNMHRAWDNVAKINNQLVWNATILLFFSSFFPHATSLVASDFNNPVGQAFYGSIVLLVTFTNVWMYQALSSLDNQHLADLSFNILDRAGYLDIGLKILGLVLALTIYPPAMMWAVLMTAVVIVLPRSV